MRRVEEAVGLPPGFLRRMQALEKDVASAALGSTVKSWQYSNSHWTGVYESDYWQYQDARGYLTVLHNSAIGACGGIESRILVHIRLSRSNMQEQFVHRS